MTKTNLSRADKNVIEEFLGLDCLPADDEVLRELADRLRRQRVERGKDANAEAEKILRSRLSDLRLELDAAHDALAKVLKSLDKVGAKK